jgi:ubiquinone/menaquinone biosynthesis C-methylase UbiE
MKTLLRIFFRLLYHQFASAYDLVAATVSLGRWNDWVMEVIPFIEGTRVLEIGHGPGHLQRVLLSRGLVAIGIDESAQMSRLAKKRLEIVGTIQKTGYAQINLTRGLAQRLPFRDQSFETIVATFPAEYITDPLTLTEVRRCLLNGGRFIVLPVAMPKNRFLSWVFRITGEAPSDALMVIQDRLAEPFVKSEFNVETHVLDLKSGTLILIVASKPRFDNTSLHSARGKDDHAQKNS